MLPFHYERAATLPGAVERAGRAGGVFLAGGTELVPWMRDGLAAPDLVVDIGRLPLEGVSIAADGTLTLGALTRLADLERHPEVRARAPLLARAIALSASPAIRHMGTLGGNLLQRTRCPHFRAGPGVACNRRAPGSGCAARAGDHRAAAILGVSEACIAAHPSDPAVALAALDASLEILGLAGPREIALESLHRLPDDAPHMETTLLPGDLITAIRLPAGAAGEQSAYIKVRDRAAFDFALVSAAAVVRVAEGRVEAVRLALGGVAPRPWRCRKAETALVGRAVTAESVRRALETELEAARPLSGNGFKVELAIRAATRAVVEAAGL